MIRYVELLVLASAAAALAQTPCDQVRFLPVANGRMLAAEVVPTGPFRIPAAGKKQAPPPAELPERCRVLLALTPSSDSHIEVEMWLPVKWNGKFQGAPMARRGPLGLPRGRGSVGLSVLIGRLGLGRW